MFSRNLMRRKCVGMTIGLHLNMLLSNIEKRNSFASINTLLSLISCHIAVDENHWPGLWDWVSAHVLTWAWGPGSLHRPCRLLDGRDPLPCISNYRLGTLFCWSTSPVFFSWFVRKAAKFSFCLSYFRLGFCHLYTASGISLL